MPLKRCGRLILDAKFFDNSTNIQETAMDAD